MRAASQGIMLRKLSTDNPLEIAQRFEDHGIRHLHVVDLEGAKANRIINYKALEQLAKRTRLKIDFEGDSNPQRTCVLHLNVAPVR